MVWEVLTDFASYPAWSSYLQEITGPRPAAAGSESCKGSVAATRRPAAEG